MLERNNPLGFNPNKVSGTFNRQQIYLKQTTKDVWDSVYLKNKKSYYLKSNLQRIN
jgi:hypothetical protein